MKMFVLGLLHLFRFPFFFDTLFLLDKNFVHYFHILFVPSERRGGKKSEDWSHYRISCHDNVKFFVV